jgi:hypothetical protein
VLEVGPKHCDRLTFHTSSPNRRPKAAHNSTTLVQKQRVIVGEVEAVVEAQLHRNAAAVLFRRRVALNKARRDESSCISIDSTHPAHQAILHKPRAVHCHDSLSSKRSS